MERIWADSAVPDVDTDDVLKLLYEFLDTHSGERFAITNQSLLDFTSYVAIQVNSGVDLSELRKRAKIARDFAIRSALDENSVVELNLRQIPLIREKDTSRTVGNCENFSDF